jgi:hypothetical protein
MKIKEIFESYSAMVNKYQGDHKPPSPPDDSPLHDLTDTYGDNIYTPNALRYFGTGGNVSDDKQAIAVIQNAKDDPDAVITVYRAVPKGVDAKINRGDWVTITKGYAAQHGQYFDEYDVVSMQVPAKSLYNDGNSIQEWGYW